jgi:hypothetical protein
MSDNHFLVSMMMLIGVAGYTTGTTKNLTLILKV